MSRSISIWYSQNGNDTSIDVGSHALLGTQSISKRFWSLQILHEFGLKTLTKLGTIDPVSFVGKEDLQLLDLEISKLEKNK